MRRKRAAAQRATRARDDGTPPDGERRDSLSGERTDTVTPSAELPAPNIGAIAAAERFLTAATVLGATVYVLLNGLYVEFYDEFGVRPEEVGIDRLTVLSRAAWIAIVGIASGSVILYLSATRGARAGMSASAAYSDEVRSGPQKLALSTRWVAVAAGLVLAAGAAVIVAFFVLEDHMNDLAAKARMGKRVGGVGWNSELIDVRAAPATISWLGEKAAPAPLQEVGRVHMYLGRGENVVALLTCEGDTVLVEPSNVQVTVLGTREGETDAAGWPEDPRDCSH
jgi:hypothetical protein